VLPVPATAFQSCKPMKQLRLPPDVRKYADCSSSSQIVSNFPDRCLIGFPAGNPLGKRLLDKLFHFLFARKQEKHTNAE